MEARSLVGWEKSSAAASRFKTVLEMVAATEKEWREVPGVGKVLAKKIVEAVNGETAD